jgi:hypothetical protein
LVVLGLTKHHAVKKYPMLKKRHDIKTYLGSEGIDHAFLTSGPDEGEWQLHALAVLPRGRAPDTHWIGSWVDPRAGLEEVANICYKWISR